MPSRFVLWGFLVGGDSHHEWLSDVSSGGIPSLGLKSVTGVRTHKV